MENFSMVDFNWFDAIIGSIIIILGIKGFINGFFKEIFGLVGLIGGIIGAFILHEPAAKFISTTFIQLKDNETLATLFGFISILLIIWISATILGEIFSKLTKASGLSFLSRILGFFTGAGKYFLIFSIIFTALQMSPLMKENIPSKIKDSISYPYLMYVGQFLFNFDPTLLKSNTQNVIDTNTINNTDSNKTK